MQVFVTHQGRSTTVSVGDELMQLLGVKLRMRHDQADQSMQLQFAKHAVRAFIARAPGGMDGGLSQYVQQAIIHTIAAPELIALLPSRSSAVGQIDFPALAEQAISDFLNELIEKNNRYQRAVADLIRKRVRRPKRKFGVSAL